MSLRTIRIVLFALIGVVIGGYAAVYGLSLLRGPATRPSVLIQPTNTIGGPFSLIDQTGKPVTDKDLIGRPVAMFFGYTYCPDVCPTTLAEAGQWLKALGPDGDRLQVIFVTVDPARDTVDKVRTYLSSFDPRIRGLTGSPDAIGAALKAYRVFARKVPSETGGDYLMDHTAGVYLMDAKGYFVGLVNYQDETEKTIAKLKELVART